MLIAPGNMLVGFERASTGARRNRRTTQPTPERPRLVAPWRDDRPEPRPRELRLHLVVVVKFAMTFPAEPKKVAGPLVEHPFIR